MNDYYLILSVDCFSQTELFYKFRPLSVSCNSQDIVEVGFVYTPNVKDLVLIPSLPRHTVLTVLSPSLPTYGDCLYVVLVFSE
jgi:hypothetical protein